MLTAYCFFSFNYNICSSKIQHKVLNKKAVHIAFGSFGYHRYYQHFPAISVTCFTKISGSPLFSRKLQLFIDSYKELLYYHAHNLIMGDEEKSKCTSLAKRAFILVQEGAGGDIEDGLGADGLRCWHLGRPGAPVTVLEY